MWSIFTRTARTIEQPFAPSRSYTAFTDPAVEFSIGRMPNSHAPSMTDSNTPSNVGANVMLGTENALQAAIWL